MGKDTRVRLGVNGFVQGVGYRFFVVHQARRLGVTGWVRNRPDGTVEVVAEGEQGMIHEFVQCLRRGPAAADVRDVAVRFEPYRGEFDGFAVRYTST